MSQVKTYTTAEIRYGTQGGSFVTQADHEREVAALGEALAQAEITRASWQNGYDVRVQEVQLLVAKNKALQERGPGLALPAVAKGSNTLEQKDGKYRISLEFSCRDDAWAAYQELVDLTSREVSGSTQPAGTPAQSITSDCSPCQQPQAHPARCGCEE